MQEGGILREKKRYGFKAIMKNSKVIQKENKLGCIWFSLKINWYLVTKLLIKN
jgi:hypothetical protein